MTETMLQQIERKKKERKNKGNSTKYKILDEDVQVLSGSYKGMTFTDIEVFNPGYIDYMVTCMRTEDGVRMVAKMIQDDRKRFLDNIDREIALGGS